MSHIVESCPLTKLNGGLSRLHSADEDTFGADQLWFMTRIREEEGECNSEDVTKCNWNLAKDKLAK